MPPARPARGSRPAPGDGGAIAVRPEDPGIAARPEGARRESPRPARTMPFGGAFLVDPRRTPGLVDGAGPTATSRSPYTIAEQPIPGGARSAGPPAPSALCPPSPA